MCGAEETPRLAITLGDPRGIGPEVTRGALERLGSVVGRVRLVGPRGTVADGAAPFDEVGVLTRSPTPAEAGRIAGAAIEHATRLALDGEVDAIVTAPIEKQALSAAGYPFPGHTEMLAALAGTPTVAMMLTAERTALGGALRVVLVTTHLALRDVSAALTADAIVDRARITHDALRGGWAITAPRLALCAFNPHASDGGLFGDEEARLLAPAVERLQAGGIDCVGPVSADTVFVRALRGEFDAVLAPYHDVGMAAFKTAAFGAGVNVTLGLPFVRTSPDHGTAFDIAGRGVADPSSMVEAIRLALHLAAPALRTA